jgi:ketosteroid isomerase-like protein
MTSSGSFPAHTFWRIVFVVSAIILLIYGAMMLHTRVTTDSATRAKNVKAVTKVLEDQAIAWNKGDLDGFMAGYWMSENLTFSSGRNVRKGWKATFDDFRERYQAEGKEMGKLTFSELDVNLLDSQNALVRGRWKVVQTQKSLDGLFTLWLHKEPEGWRIRADHTSAGE